jgi:hypothetical protein
MRTRTAIVLAATLFSFLHPALAADDASVVGAPGRST